MIFLSVSPKQIPRINFLLHIVQTSIVAVGNNRLALRFECFQIIHDLTAEEGASIWQRGFINNHFRSFRLDAFHHALDTRLAEIVAVRLHGQPIDANHAFLFFIRAEITSVIVIVTKRFLPA